MCVPWRQHRARCPSGAQWDTSTSPPGLITACRRALRPWSDSETWWENTYTHTVAERPLWFIAGIWLLGVTVYINIHAPKNTPAYTYVSCECKCIFIYMCMYRHTHKCMLVYHKTVWTDSPVYVCLPQRRRGEDRDHHRPGCAPAAAGRGEGGGHQRLCAQDENSATTYGADGGKHSWLDGQVSVHNAGLWVISNKDVCHSHIDHQSSLLVGTLTLRQRMLMFSSIYSGPVGV